jgi:hypothetical protein
MNLMIRRGTIVVTAVLSFLLPCGSAFATISGSFQAHCTAILNAFPSAGSTGTCGNDITPAISDVFFTGVDSDGAPYAVVGPGTFVADFNHNAACNVDGLPPALWTANGGIRASGLTSTRGTAIYQSGFFATFVGAQGIVLTDNSRIAFASGGAATGATPNFGTIEFIPLLSPSNLCPVGGVLLGPMVWTDYEGV